MRKETRCVVPSARLLVAVMAMLAVVGVGLGTAGAGVPGTCGTAAASPQKSAESTPAHNDAVKPAQATPAEASGQAGMRAFIDPATGQFREPTSEEAATLNRFIARAFALPLAPQVVQYPNGMLSAELGEDYMNDVIVRKNPDGTLSWVCVPRPLSETVLTTPAPPKSPELEKE